MTEAEDQKKQKVDPVAKAYTRAKEWDRSSAAPVDPLYLLRSYAEWPGFEPGTEDRADITEQIKADLTALTGEDAEEQAFFTPQSRLAGLGLYFGAVAGLLIVAWDQPQVAAILSWGMLALFLWLSDGRRLGFTEMGTRAIAENLMVRVPGGRNLIILTASLCPRPKPMGEFLGLHSETCHLIRLCCLCLFPVALSAGIFVAGQAFWGLALAAALVAGGFTLQRHWNALTGRFESGSQSLADVAAVIALADRLLKKPILDCEILLCLTGGVADPKQGWQNLLESRDYDLDARPVTLISFNGLGGQTLCFTRGLKGVVSRGMTKGTAAHAARALKADRIAIGFVDYPADTHPLTPLLKPGFDACEIGSVPQDGWIDDLSGTGISQAVDAVEKALRQRLAREI